MADGIKSYSEQSQQSQYKAGIKGSDFFGAPNPPPAMTVVDGYPAEVNQKLMGGPLPAMEPYDPWVQRSMSGK